MANHYQCLLLLHYKTSYMHTSSKKHILINFCRLLLLTTRPCTQCMFLAIIYVCIHAWRRNLVYHNMKFSIASPIFCMGGLSISTFLRRTYSSFSLFYTSTDTQPSYIVISYNVPPSTFITFPYATNFPSSLTL